jgi:hypothetical protein
MYTTVSGGRNNVATVAHATVGGGAENRALNNSATVAGGFANTASGYNSTVSGGVQNSATGYGATVAGGLNSHAGGSYSYAVGHFASAIHDGAFIWADFTPDSTFSSEAINEFAARATGGVRFVTGLGPRTGVQVAAGGGSWSSISDRNAKENFRDVDCGRLLEKVVRLPISTWNYKAQDEAIRHIGPMAQDFYEAFSVGEDDQHIATVDADGVALAAIKALYQSQQELALKSQRIEHLEARVAKLEEIVRTLAGSRNSLHGGGALTSTVSSEVNDD